MKIVKPLNWNHLFQQVKLKDSIFKSRLSPCLESQYEKSDCRFGISIKFGAFYFLTVFQKVGSGCDTNRGAADLKTEFKFRVAATPLGCRSSTSKNWFLINLEWRRPTFKTILWFLEVGEQTLMSPPPISTLDFSFLRGGGDTNGSAAKLKSEFKFRVAATPLGCRSSTSKNGFLINLEWMRHTFKTVFMIFKVGEQPLMSPPPILTRFLILKVAATPMVAQPSWKLDFWWWEALNWCRCLLQICHFLKNLGGEDEFETEAFPDLKNLNFWWWRSDLKCLLLRFILQFFWNLGRRSYHWCLLLQFIFQFLKSWIGGATIECLLLHFENSCDFESGETPKCSPPFIKS